MTPAVLDRPGSLFEGAPGTAAAPPGRGGGVTLDELLNATLHAARSNGSAECPVCHARMTVGVARTTSTRASAGATSAGAECGGRHASAERGGGAGDTPAGAECGGCGSALS